MPPNRFLNIREMLALLPTQLPPRLTYAVVAGLAELADHKFLRELRLNDGSTYRRLQPREAVIVAKMVSQSASPTFTHAQEAARADRYESNLKARYPVVEWVGNVDHLGRPVAGQGEWIRVQTLNLLEGGAA